MNRRNFLKGSALVAVATGLVCGAMGANEVPRRVLELPPSAENCRNSEGDFALLKDGSVLLVYSHYVKGKGGDHDPAHLGTRISKDGGRTWSTTSGMAVANEGGMNVMSVSTLRLKDGSLALFYLRKNSEEDCRPVMRVSKDEGKTWGEPVKCVSDADVNYYVLNNCRAERLRNGRIILPMCVHAAKNGRTADWQGKLVCALSDDDGATWRLNGQPFPTFDDKGKRVTTQEPGVIQLKDGRLLMYARTGHGRHWFYYSADNGDTWTKGEPGTLWGPCGPATLKRLKNGDIFAVWNDHEDAPELKQQDTGWGQRVPLTVAISKDEGRTWIHRHTLEGNLQQGWYCYIAVIELDGRLLLEYCAMESLRHSRVTEVPLAWIYGSDVRPAFVGSGASAFSACANGVFTRLDTRLGTWTADQGQGEIHTWTRGKGVRVMGGENRCVTLTLPKAAASDALNLFAERFTSRAPYELTVEAKTVDGNWQEVYREGAKTPVGRLRKMAFRRLAPPVTAYRFRCTSVLGALFTDVTMPFAFSDAFFTD